ncbi:hypothetical protein C8A01DRAFT_15094 [Parachaetomium inaequale]|uniref:Uncharacterized protein n=1 Tax=Parachaetomium inaequale TaxID=2588326 RepID=A0AAN6PJ96_9PEZI|nr:hypothetical protein C8A01DRAFT_15094 [Parachaetomium inaequale]
MIGHGSKSALSPRQDFGRKPFVAGPGFCFKRFGRTETKLPDGRIVYIGGQQGNFFDSDYFIYNDVVVVRGHSDGRARAQAKLEAFLAQVPDLPIALDEHNKRVAMAHWLNEATAVEGASPDEIDIYGYPTDVFPAVDFHTATYHKHQDTGKEYIYIIGGLGYKGGPHRRATLTHRLSLEDFSIQRMETMGEEPPPCRGRTARREGDEIVLVVQGDQYVLSLTNMRWTRAPE